MQRILWNLKKNVFVNLYKIKIEGLSWQQQRPEQASLQKYQVWILALILWWFEINCATLVSTKLGKIYWYTNALGEDYLKLLQWRYNGRDSVRNLQSHGCFLNRLFRRRSTKTSKLRFAGLCAGNSPRTGEFHAQMASNASNVSIWWRHHVNLSKLLWLGPTKPFSNSESG